MEAYGVETSTAGQKCNIRAQKEVIVPAGVFQTSEILELSGIGGHQLLSKHGIDAVIDDVNAGESLQDHLMTGISLEVLDSVQTADSLMRQGPQALQAA